MMDDKWCLKLFTTMHQISFEEVLALKIGRFGVKDTLLVIVKD